jgi:hypothetical protein
MTNRPIMEEVIGVIGGLVISNQVQYSALEISMIRRVSIVLSWEDRMRSKTMV